MNEAIIVFKFPSRSRPQKFRGALESIVENLARPDLARFMFTLDDNDPKKELYNKVLDDFKLDYHASFGESKNKIAAVNRDLEDIDSIFQNWRILVCMSDDMTFIQSGFDNIIRESFTENDLTLHFPDQNQGEKCMTMSVMDRDYFTRTRKIYHDDYISVECDLEEQEKAQMLGRYKYVPRRIFNHNHPSFGQSDYDQQYRITESFEVHEADKATRRRRKEMNYGLINDGEKWYSVVINLEKFSQEVKIKFPLENSPIKIDETSITGIGNARFPIEKIIYSSPEPPKEIQVTKRTFNYLLIKLSNDGIMSWTGEKPISEIKHFYYPFTDCKISAIA